jgi:SNF2 family DNA or RNA helicase
MRHTPRLAPYAHQVKARGAMNASDGPVPSFALFMEMGTGKTYVDLAETLELFNNAAIDVAVVLAPKGVYLNWLNREIPAIWPEEFIKDALVVEWRSGGGSKAHASLLTRLLEPAPRPRILVMNVEALSSGAKASNYLEKFLKSAQVAAKMTVDESTFIKNPTANRTEECIRLGELARYRRILTGSPVTRSPLDLWGQLRFLFKTPLGFSSYYSFRGRYAIMQKKFFGGRNVNVVVGYRDIESLTEKLRPISFRVRKDECLDLPPKVYEIRDVELTAEQKKIYDDIRRTATAQLDESSHVTATEVIVQILRLHQVVCGHVTDENGVMHDVPTNRVDDLMDVLGEYDGKAIIWSHFRRDTQKIVDAIEKVYGSESVVQYHGGTSMQDREIAVQKFQDPASSVRFMVSNQQTGGYGNTWTQAGLVVYFSNDFDLERRAQSEDRAHRSGQTKSVTYVDLCARGTVDEKILKSLRAKIDISSTIMGDGYRQWLI